MSFAVFRLVELPKACLRAGFTMCAPFHTATVLPIGSFKTVGSAVSSGTEMFKNVWMVDAPSSQIND